MKPNISSVILLLFINIIFLLSIHGFVWQAPTLHNIYKSKSNKQIPGTVYSQFGDDSSFGSNDNGKNVIPTGSIRKKNGGSNYDDRNSLPYSVFFIRDENLKSPVGTYMLDATVTSGDILDLGDKGVYTVKRVSFLYKYTRGGFRVFKKKIDVTSASVGWKNDDESTGDVYFQ